MFHNSPPIQGGGGGGLTLDVKSHENNHFFSPSLMQVSQVMPESLAHQWVDFWIISLWHKNITSNTFLAMILIFWVFICIEF